MDENPNYSPEDEEEGGDDRDNGSSLASILGEELSEKLKPESRQDGIISAKSSQYVGPLQKLATAVKGETEYRQALLLSTFLSREDATRVVAALDERRRYGANIQPIVDLITAWAAVVGADGGRVH